MTLTRRTFLKTGMAGFGSILLMPSCFRDPGPYRFFTMEEARCVIAMAEQIIPADEHGGGATEAGVIHYIDRQLVAVFDYDQLLYQEGIAALQQYCLDQYARRFEDLEPGRQTEILKRMEKGELSTFFNRVLQHTMQGFYGPPRHGGNKDYMSYRMMRIDFPLVVGRNHYEHLKEES